MIKEREGWRLPFHSILSVSAHNHGHALYLALHNFKRSKTKILKEVLHTSRKKFLFLSMQFHLNSLLSSKYDTISVFRLEIKFDSIFCKQLFHEQMKKFEGCATLQDHYYSSCYLTLSFRIIRQAIMKMTDYQKYIKGHACRINLVIGRRQRLYWVCLCSFPQQDTTF